MNYYFLFIFPLLFVGMWTLITYLIFKQGWEDLAASYKANSTFVGKRVGIISVAVNTANYQNAIILKYNSEGMYLKTVLFLRLFHKPVFIPWTEVKHVRDKKLFFWSLKELIIGEPFVASIKLRSSVYKKIEQFIKQ